MFFALNEHFFCAFVGKFRYKRHNAAGMVLSVVTNCDRKFAISNGDAGFHYITVKRRPAVVGHQYGLDEETDLTSIMPQCLRDVKFFVSVGRHDDGYVDIAVGTGVPLGIGAEHHHARLHLKTRCNHLLIASDEPEGFVAAESSSFIHDCNCFVSSIISLHANGVSVWNKASLSSG